MIFEENELIVFGGKGGTGKTTCAAATGLGLADRGQEVLVASMDPAHSLGDSLGVEVGDEPEPVDGQSGLHGVELNAEKLIENYKNQHSNYLEELLERGTYLDGSDVSNLLDLPLPGLDEVSAVLELNNYYHQDKYDVLLLDTPPTGHFYNLINLPEQMLQWLDVLDLMAEKHRHIKSSLVGEYPEDEIERFLDSQKEEIKFTDRLLSDGSTTQFVPVLRPNSLSFSETRRLFRNTELEKITSMVFFNRVEQDGNCQVCKGRKDRSKNYLNRFRRDFPELAPVTIRNFPEPVSGLNRLRSVTADIFSEETSGSSDVFGPTSRVKTSRSSIKTDSSPADSLGLKSKYLFFSGKGGVGKSTAAASAGLNMAKKRKERVLILSIDPAGSLNDLFSEEIERRPTTVMPTGKGELHAMETNPEKEIEELKEKYREAIEGGFRSYSRSSGVSLKYDREILSKLFSLIPPGVTEVTALVNLIEQVDRGSYERIIVDTAPTGHLLRFLQLPGIAKSWLSTMLDTSLKYRKIVDSRNITDEIASMLRKVREIQQLFFTSGGSATSLVAVTIPERMASKETNRLRQDAEEAGVQRIHLLINKVLEGELCGSCIKERKAQNRIIGELSKKPINGEVTSVPYLPREPEDEESLLEFSKYFLG